MIFDINERLRPVPAYVLFFVLAFVPLPFGSYDKITIAFWCVPLGTAAMLAALTSNNLRKPQILLLSGIGSIVAIYGFVLHEQLSETPWVAVPHPLWEQVSRTLGIEVSPSVSITKGEPLFALGPPLANVLALICGIVVGGDRLRARQLLQIVAWSGAAYAIYGILSFLIEPTMLLWREKSAYLGNLTATFVNRNTAAAYFGSCSSIWLAMVLEKIRRRRLRNEKISWGATLRGLLVSERSATIRMVSMLLLCLVAMFLTGSRAGIMLSLLVLVVVFVAYLGRYLTLRGGVWAATGLAIFSALILLELMGGIVSNRFNVQGLADEGRFVAYRSTIEMICDHPWFGTGLGTFAWAFPAYRDSGISMSGVWDIAHNTPLELAAEAGLPLAVSVFLGWIVIFAVLVHGARSRHRDHIFPVSALAVATIAVLHSCIDFSLQIPGYSIIVFAVVGAGLAQSFRSENDNPSRGLP